MVIIPPAVIRMSPVITKTKEAMVIGITRSSSKVTFLKVVFLSSLFMFLMNPFFKLQLFERRDTLRGS